jgi:hypothetical protein
MEGRAADYGVAPFTFYLRTLWSSTGPVLLLLVAALTRLPRAAWGLGAVVLAHGLVHSLLPHKELRFLAPVTPLGLALVAVALGAWLGRLAARRPRWLPAHALTAAVGATAALLLVLRTPGLSYADLGRLKDDQQARQRAGHNNDAFNRLLLQAHALPDLCGLAVAGAHIIWMGGYSYLHRDVPFFELDAPRAEGSPAANYLLAPSAWSAPPAATEVARLREAVLYRYDRPCAPPPDDYRRFELPVMGARQQQ